jgi:hypothetical protein
MMMVARSIGFLGRDRVEHAPRLTWRRFGVRGSVVGGGTGAGRLGFGDRVVAVIGGCGPAACVAHAPCQKGEHIRWERFRVTALFTGILCK